MSAHGRTLLQARGVSVTLGGESVLHDVSLLVRAGEVTGLIGPNGAGKSTFLRAATSLLPLTGGSIELEGEPLRSKDRNALARSIAVVQQLPQAPSWMRVDELALLGRSPYLGPFARESAHDYAVAAEAMERAGCAQHASRPLGTLSGGQRRRAFIARALAQEAPLLLMDEPTSNLDIQAQCEIFDLIRELAGEGTGTMVVVHDLTLAAAYCDHLVLLAAGRVVADGHPDEVVTTANVARVYGQRMTVINDVGRYRPIVVPTMYGDE